MERVTLRVPKGQVEDLEEFVKRDRFASRSEAIRTAIRRLIDEERKSQRSADKARREKPWARADGGRRP